MQIYVKSFESFIDNLYQIGYHGSSNNFTSFSFNYINTGDLFYGYGIYFTDSIKKASNYGKVIKKCRLRMANPFVIDLDDLDTFLSIRNRGELFDYHISPEELTKRLKEKGFDSVKVLSKGSIAEIVIFDLENIEIINTIILSI